MLADRGMRLETKKSEDSASFSEVEHKHKTFVTVSTVHMIASILYMF